MKRTRASRKRRFKIITKKYAKDIMFVLLGAFLLACGTTFFLLPNQLSSGGFTGIATIIYYLMEMPIGTILIALNVPFFIFAFFKLGKELFVKAIIGMIAYSLFANILESVSAFTEDRLLACIYGGLLMGAGTGFVFKANASTGGTDLLSYLVKAYKPNIKIGYIMNVIDFIIVVANAIFFKEIEIGLYSAICIYIYGKMIDIIFEGVSLTKKMYIISPKYEKIAKQISQRVNRGSTGIYIKGMFKDEDSIMLLCVGNRGEISQMKQIALKIDKSAFIIISNSREAWGKGFKMDKRI